ncbi:MAG: CsiV family protein [Pseudomonadales bacterium]
MPPTLTMIKPLTSIRLLFALLISANATLVMAAPPSSDKLLSGKYYQIELIVFTRLNVSEANTAEQLTALDGGHLPAGVASFLSVDGERGYPFELESKTQRMLRASGRFFGQRLPLPRAGSLVADIKTEMAQSTGQIERAADSPSEPATGIDPEQALADAISRYEQELADTSFAFRSDGLSQLTEVAARLNRSRGYRLLHSGAWHQHVPARKQALPLLIQAGQRTEDNYQLEGTLSVGLGRYLHVGADFWYYEPELGAYTEVVADDSDNASSPDAALTSINSETAAEDLAATASAGDTAPKLNYRTVLPPGDYRMHLSQKRRMRSAELHYLDHPKLGVLVRIDPVPLSQAVITAYEAARGR